MSGNSWFGFWRPLKLSSSEVGGVRVTVLELGMSTLCAPTGEAGCSADPGLWLAALLSLACGLAALLSLRAYVACG